MKNKIAVHWLRQDLRLSDNPAPKLTSTHNDDGNYLRKFISELASLPNKYLFSLREALDNILKKAGVTLDKSYDKHRNAALEVFQSLKKGAS